MPETRTPETRVSEAAFFPGFRALDCRTQQARLKGVIGGSGPPVLLLHGYPQTHLTWRHVAPRLAERFTVIAPDLPGYGDSRVDAAFRSSKRSVAQELIEMMTHLGYPRFAVAGHDRGGRVGYRMALDHPERVAAFTSVTVVPTATVFDAVDAAFALNAWHWFFLAQPFDLPERLLSADPDAFLDRTLEKMAGGLDRLDPAALAEYRRCFRDPDVRHAMCEDYRAGATVDREHDCADRAAGRKLACPVLFIWERHREKSGKGALPDLWRAWADDVTSHAIDGGHLLPEQAADDVLAALLPFLERNRPF